MLGFEYDLKIHKLRCERCHGASRTGSDRGRGSIHRWPSSSRHARSSRHGGHHRQVWLHPCTLSGPARYGRELLPGPLLPAKCPWARFRNFVCHIMRNVDPVGLFPFTVVDAQGDNTYVHEPRKSRIVLQPASCFPINPVLPRPAQAHQSKGWCRVEEEQTYKCEEILAHARASGRHLLSC